MRYTQLQKPADISVILSGSCVRFAALRSAFSASRCSVAPPLGNAQHGAHDRRTPVRAVARLSSSPTEPRSLRSGDGQCAEATTSRDDR